MSGHVFVKYNRVTIPLGPQIGDLDAHKRDREFTHETYLRECNFAAGGIGCSTWDAAILMGQFILEQHDIFVGKTIHEIGAGIGYPGIVASRYASRVILSDYVDFLLDNMKYNIQYNSPQGTPTPNFDYVTDSEFVPNTCFDHRIENELCTCLKRGGNVDDAVPHIKMLLENKRKELETENTNSNVVNDDHDCSLSHIEKNTSSMESMKNFDWRNKGDISPDMSIIEANIAKCRQHTVGRVKVALLDWLEYDQLTDIEKKSLKCDIILGSEVSYSQILDTLSSLLHIINDTLSDTGVVYICQSENRCVHEDLVKGMEDYGFTCDINRVPDELLKFYASGQNIEGYLYYTFRRPNSPYPVMKHIPL